MGPVIFILVLSIQTGVLCGTRCLSSCNECYENTQTCLGPCKHEHNYGERCDKTCPVNCIGGCNKMDGSCNRCLPAYSGQFCNDPCPSHCQSSCNKDTIECDNCKYNFTGPFCNETCQAEGSITHQYSITCIEPCPDKGTYGDDCEEPCSKNCRDGCYRDTGECVNCAEGFGGLSCDDSCPVNCINGCDRYIGICNDCREGFSGGRCSEKCPANCKERCYQNTGHCIECTRGFQGRFCNATCSINCLRNCDQNTGECEVTATGNNLIKVVCGALGAALVLGVTMIIVVKRRRHIILQNRRTSLDAILEANYHRESNSTGRKYYEIGDDILVNKREMVTARNSNLPLQDVSLPPPLPSQRIPQRSPPQQDVHPLLPPPLPSQRIPRRSPPSKKEVNLQLPPPLPSHRKPPDKPQQDVDLLLPPSLPNQRDPQWISLTQQDVDLWSPCPSPCQQVQAKTSCPKTSRPLSAFGRNQRNYYLDAIFESNINSASTFTEHKYYAIDENNLAKDSRDIVTARRDVTLPAPLPNPRSSLSGQDKQDLSTRPKQDFCLLPSQEHPPLQQDDLELHTPLPCQRNQVKSPRPKRVNYHFECDFIFENAIYESADEVLFPNKEIVPPKAEGKEKQILLEEEPENLKHPVAVGGASVVASPDIEVVPIPNIVTDDDDDNIVNEILETSV